MSTHQLSALTELSTRLDTAIGGSQAQHSTKIQTHHRRLAEALKGLHSIATTPSPMDSTGAHILKIQKASRKLQEEVIKTREETTRLLAIRKAEVEDTLRNVANIKQDAYAPEIRARFANLPQSERMDLLQSIIDARDGASFAAIVEAPFFLTGLDPQLKDRMTESFYQQAAPEFFDERKALDDVSSLMDSSLRLVDRAAGGYQDPALTAKIEREANEAAQAAEAFAKAFEAP